MADVARVRTELARAYHLWSHGGKTDRAARDRARQALENALEAGVLDTEYRQRAWELSNVLR